MSERNGLILSLKPNEKFLVGGCLVQNGPKRSSIRIVDDGTFVLRLSDALHPDHINTPVTRTYHVAQLILACEIDKELGHEILLARLAELIRIFAKTEGAASVARAAASASSRRYHGVLTALKALIPIEESLLPHDGTGEHTHRDAECIEAGRR